MQKSAGLLLVIIGGVMIYQGWLLKNSLAGEMAMLGTKVVNKVDGGIRMPDHVYYLAGGALLVVAGAGFALRKSA